MSNQDLAQEQREHLEEEISLMAEQLKHSTLKMNTTLKSQSQNLGQMQELAEENVDKVGRAAENVQQHVSRGWRRTFFTWTLIVAVMGTFVFCIMTMKLVPKRPNACIPFLTCPKQLSDDHWCRTLPDGNRYCVAPEDRDRSKSASNIGDPIKQERRREEEIKPRQQEEVLEPEDDYGYDEEQLYQGEDGNEDDEAAYDEEYGDKATDEAGASTCESGDSSACDAAHDLYGSEPEEQEPELGSENVDAPNDVPVCEDGEDCDATAFLYGEDSDDEKTIEPPEEVPVAKDENGDNNDDATDSPLSDPEADTGSEENVQQLTEPMTREAEHTEESQLSEAEEMRTAEIDSTVEEEPAQEQELSADTAMDQKEANEAEREAASSEPELAKDGPRHKEGEDKGIKENVVSAAEESPREKESIPDSMQEKEESGEVNKPAGSDTDPSKENPGGAEAVKEDGDDTIQTPPETHDSSAASLEGTGGQREKASVLKQDATETQATEPIAKHTKQQTMATEAATKTSVNVGQQHASQTEDRPTSSTKEDKTEPPMLPQDKFPHINAEQIRSAASQCRFILMRKLVQRRPDLANEADVNGFTPMHEAASRGCSKELMYLLDNVEGIDVNQRTWDSTKNMPGGTALWWARDTGMGDDHEVITLLLERGALSIGPNSEEVASETVQTETDPLPEVTDTPDEPIDFSPDDIRVASFKGDLGALTRILERKPEWANEADQNGWTGLHEAVRNHHVEVVQVLLEKGVDVNARVGPNRDGPTATSMAMESFGASDPLVQLLLQRGGRV